MTVLGRDNVAMAFGTPIATIPLSNAEPLNDDLRRVIVERERRGAGIKKSNVGGWHSTTDLFTWPDSCVSVLRDHVVANLQKLTAIVSPNLKSRVNLTLTCWANVSRRGHYNSVHDHASSVWSGVYYVEKGKPVGDDPLNGRLEFIDPRVGVAMSEVFEGGMIGGRYLVEPLPGLLVIFPSWLKHMVHPFEGTGERISISFNARMEIAK
jgi:uncharacterized protein (TIGR02466 family)